MEITKVFFFHLREILVLKVVDVIVCGSYTDTKGALALVLPPVHEWDVASLTGGLLEVSYFDRSAVIHFNLTIMHAYAHIPHRWSLRMPYILYT